MPTTGCKKHPAKNSGLRLQAGVTQKPSETHFVLSGKDLLLEFGIRGPESYEV